MSLLITPGQLTGRSELFHQLAQVTASGLGLITALEMLLRNPPRQALREPIARVLQHLQNGETFGRAIERSGRWLSSFDVALLKAGEKSGRLPDCFRVLAHYYAQRAALARQVIAFSAYPVVVFHVAVMIFPISMLTDLVLKGSVAAFLIEKVLVFAPVYGLVLFTAWALQGTHAEHWRASVERVLAMVPVLGKARRNLALARLALALDALLNAGVDMIDSWEMAAAASGSPSLRRVVARNKAALQAGTTPSEMVSANREFSTTFAALYHTGEISGTLDDSMRRAHALHEDEGSRQLRTFVFGLAGVFVGCVMLAVAYNIVMFYAKYFQSIGDAADGKF